MINRMLNSRASRAFKLESKLQLFLIVVIVLMSANIISATNITDNSSINNLSGNFAGQTTTIIDINITVNITGINSTKINMTPEVNETANITNETDNNAVEKLNVTINESGETEIAHFVYGQETTQLEAEISKPVLWITKRTAVNATNITFILPKDADTEKINANNTEDISNLIIEKEENETKVTITLNQICSDDYYLLYQTPAPVLGLINESIENNIYRKFIIAKSNSTLNYADVLCRLNLSGINSTLPQNIRFSSTFMLSDDNLDSFADEISWNIPLLDNEEIFLLEVMQPEEEIVLDNLAFNHTNESKVIVYREQSNGLGRSKAMDIEFIIENKENSTIDDVVIEDILPNEWSVAGATADFFVDENKISLNIGSMKSGEIKTVHYEIKSAEDEGIFSFSSTLSYRIENLAVIKNLSSESIEVNSTKAFFQTKLDLNYYGENETRIIGNATYPALLTIRNIGEESVTKYETFVTISYNNTNTEISDVEKCREKTTESIGDSSTIHCVFNTFHANEEKNIIFNLFPKTELSDGFLEINITYDPPQEVYLPLAKDRDEKKNPIETIKSAISRFFFSIFRLIREKIIAPLSNGITGQATKELTEEEAQTKQPVNETPAVKEEKEQKEEKEESSHESTEETPEEKIEEKREEEQKETPVPEIPRGSKVGSSGGSAAPEQEQEKPEEDEKKPVEIKVWHTSIQKKNFFTRDVEPPEELTLPFSHEIKDSKGEPVAVKQKFKKNDEGNYDIEITVDNQISNIGSIVLNNVVMDNKSSLGLRVDSVPEENVTLMQVKTAFAIDPSAINFTNGTMSVTASGRELWKCGEWDFSAQNCYGEWVKIRDIVPGEEYIILLSPEDPGYAETGVATINTNKSVYHPGEEANIIMVVLDTAGYLVDGAEVSLDLMSPDSVSYHYSTGTGTITETRTGIYEAVFTNTNIEGNYSMGVTAIANNVNNTMESHFRVADYYEFDILRSTPVTTDPWQGAFNSEIRIISHTDYNSFNFTEVLPINFTIEDAGGATVTEFNNKKTLTWESLGNNSIVSYSAQPPLITPDMYGIGPSYIDSGGSIFTEARQWFLAIDPYGGINATGIAAVDIAMCPMTNSSFVITWVESGADPNDRLRVAIYNTNGTRIVGPVDVDTSIDTTSRVDCAAVNSSHFAIGWIDGPVDDMFVASYDDKLNLLNGPTQLDNNVGSGGNDVSLTTMPGKQVIAAYVDQQESDPDYYNINFDTWTTGYENRVDSSMGPDTNLRELFGVFGLNATRVAHGWFDDNNGDYFRVSTSDGAATTNEGINSPFGDSQVEVIGADGMVSGAGLRENRVAYGIFDSGDNNVYMMVDDYTGDARLSVKAMTSIDANSQGCGGIATAEIDADGNSYFAVAWHDGNAGDIKAGVYNYNGNQITAPFTVSAAPDDTYLLLDVMSSDSIAGVHICNGTFIVAYTNSTNMVEFKRYKVDGTEWHGICNPKAPNVTLINPPDYNYFNYTNINFTFNVTSRYEGVYNCTLWTNETSWSMKERNTTSVLGSVSWINETFSSDGTYKWNMQCLDTYGPIGFATFNRTIIVDTLKPGFALFTISPNPANLTLNNVSVNWTARDINLNTSFVNVSYPNGSLIGTYYSNFTITTGNLSVIGNYTITIFANDTAGNFNTTSLTLLVRDVTPPNVTLIFPANNGFSNIEPVNFTFNVSDYSNITNCSLTFNELPGGTIYNVSRNIPVNVTWYGLGDDIYNWYVNCSDEYGNEGDSATFTFILDKKAPKITLNQPFNAAWDNDGTVQMNYTPDEPGTPHFESCELWGNFSGSWAINQTNSTAISDNVPNLFNSITLQDGSYIWNIRCNDSAGNKNFSATNYTLYVDAAGPGINFTTPTPANNSYKNSSTVVINITHAENNPHTLILSWNGTNESRSYSGSFTNVTKTSLNDGTYSYYAWLNDSSGRYNVTETRILTVDTKAPRLYLEAPANNTWKSSYDNPVFFNYNTTDSLLGVSNCSLVINNKLNHTNKSIAAGISQNFSLVLEQGFYNWSINCSDLIENVNTSETRLLKVDTGFPSISNEDKNETLFGVYETICLNVTVSDSFSGIDSAYIEIYKPESGLVNLTLSNATGNCGGAGGNVWSNETMLNQQGEYNWTKTFAIDKAGNINMTYPSQLMNWSATSTVTMTSVMKVPYSNILINESEPEVNYTYLQTCNVTCDSGTCEDVTLIAAYNPATWNEITTVTTDLINTIDSKACPASLDAGEFCNYTFTIITGKEAGSNTWEIACKATSTNAPTSYSASVNLTINDHPSSEFAYPSNGTWLHGTEALNGSASTDDFNITMYVFALDDDVNFNSLSTLCTTSDSNCTLNTSSQTECSQETSTCYLRLNTTDYYGIKNSTIIQIGIDNIGPNATLDLPLNFTNISGNTFFINATLADAGSGADTATFQYRENESETWKPVCEDPRGAKYSCDWNTTELPDGRDYQVRVYANDTENNVGSADIRYNITIDRTPPAIGLEYPVNNAWNNKGVVFYYNTSDLFSDISNCSLIIDNKINITNKTIAEGIRLNFTVNNISDGNHNWSINCTDSLGNMNFSSTRLVKIDGTGPSLVLNLPWNFTNISASTYYINASVNDTGIGINSTFFEYRQNESDSWHLICEDARGSAYSCDWNTSIIPEGKTYEVRAYANDSLNNIGNYDTHYNITIDRTPPVVSLEQPSNNTQDTDGTVIFYFNVSDSLSDILNCSLIINDRINLTNATMEKGISQSITRFLDNGTYNWSINCTDTSFNVNGSETRVINVLPDTVPPEISLVSPANHYIDTDGNVIFRYNVSDSLSDIMNCSLIINDKFNKSNESAVVEGQTNMITLNNLPNGQYNWSINCTDSATSLNIGNSSTWNLTIYIATTIRVNVTLDKTTYQNGEIAHIATTTKDDLNNNLNTTITTDIIKGNTTVHWWDTAWKRRKPVLLSETTGSNRINATVSVNITGLNGYISNCTKELRIIKNTSAVLTEVPYALVDKDDLGWCYVRFQADIPANAKNNTDYYAYYNNSAATAPSYPYIGIYEYEIFFESFPNPDGDWQGSGDTAQDETWSVDVAPTDLSDIRIGDIRSSPDGNHLDFEDCDEDWGGQWAVSGIDLSDDENVSVEFLYYMDGMDAANEGFRFELSTNSGVSWSTALERTGTTNYPWTKYSLYLTSGNYTSGFQIRFNVAGSATGDAAAFDSINLTGRKKTVFNVTYSIGNEEAFVSRSENVTGTDGNDTYHFDTFQRDTGNYTAVSLATKQDYNNGSSYAWFVITPDTTYPAITLITPANLSWLNYINVTFIYNLSDNTDRFLNCSVIINNIINKTNTTAIINNALNNITITGFNQGLYSWNVNCSDAAGNKNSSVTKIFYIDTIKPSVELNSPIDGYNSSSSTIQFNFTATDNLDVNITCNLTIDGSVSVSLIEASNSSYTNVSVSSLGGGSHTWNIICIDNATNVNSTTARTLFIDTVYPRVTLNSPSNFSYDSDGTVQMSYIPFDDNLKLCELWGNFSGSWANNQTDNSPESLALNTFNQIALSDGTFIWNVNCSDISGNFNWSRGYYTVYVDTIEPAIEFAGGTENNNTYFERNWIYVNVTASDSNEANITFYLHNTTSLVNSTTLVAGNRSINFTNLNSNSLYYYNATIKDKALNQNSTPTRNITLDTTSPVINFAGGTEQNNSYRSRSWIYVNVSVAEGNENNITFYLYNSSFDKINETTLAAGTRSINFTNINSNMMYYYNVTARDKVSKENSTLTRNITLDTINPRVSLDSPENLYWDSDGQVSFSFTPYDINIQACTIYHNASGTFKANVTNNSVVSGSQATLTVTFSTEGPVVWNVLCNDSASNTAFNSTNRTIFLDTTSPVINFAGGTEQNNSYRSRSWIYVNVSVAEGNENNITFYLYNSSFDKINETTLAAGTRSINFTNINSNMMYYYNVTARDTAGKENSTLTRNIVLDTLNPSIEFITPTPVNNTNQTSTSFTINVSHYDINPGSIRLYFNNSINETRINYANYSNFSISGLGDGIYTYRVLINDSASNSNQTETRTITIDNAPPNVYLEQPINDSWKNDASRIITFKYNVSDSLLQISNCSLIINDRVNITNKSIIKGISQNFTVNFSESGYYNWSVNCTDLVGNRNQSETRTIKFDSNYPSIESPAINETNVSIFGYLCLNVTVSDAFSGVNAVIATIKDPSGTLRTAELSDAQATSCDSTNGNGVYSVLFQSNQLGTYNWTMIMANDTASNINYTYPGLEWNTSSIGRLEVNVTAPTISIEVNESEAGLNYTFNQSCTVYCMATGQNCSHVSLIPEYNLSGTSEINTLSQYLVGFENNYECGNLTQNGSSCNHSFTIRTSLDAGTWSFRLRCKANSSDVGEYFSTEIINVSINDHPVAIFKQLVNGSFLSGTVILNFSLSTDDQGLSNYSIALDNNTNFSSPSYLYSGANDYYNFDTTAQTQCSQDSFDCYLRLNVTDNDGLQNSTMISIAIDNAGPTTTMSHPLSYYNFSSNMTFVNASAVDSGIGVNATLFEYRENEFQSWSTICVDESSPYNCSWNITSLNDGIAYQVRVRANDSLGNYGGYDTETGITLDRTGPVANLTRPVNGTNITSNTYNVSADVADVHSSISNVIFEYRQNDSDSWKSACSDTDGLAPYNCTWDTSTLPNSEESYEVRVRANDSLNNFGSYSTSYNITIEKLPPGISLISPENNTYSLENVTFSFSISDDYNISNCSIIIDGNVNMTNTSVDKSQTQSFIINGFNEGNHEWRINCSNNLGLSNVSETRTIRIDLTGPNTTIDLPVNFTNISYSYMINASAADGGTGVNATIFEYRENESESWKAICSNSSVPYSCGWNTASLAEGRHYQVRARANDSLNNYGSYDTRGNITIDKTPPSVNLWQPSNNTQDIDGVISFSYNASDSLLDIKNCNLIINNSINMTNVTIEEGATHYFNTFMRNGTYIWSINCSDSAANKGSSETRTIMVAPDTAAPEVNLMRPENSTTYTNPDVTFVYNVTDALSDIKNCSLIFNDKFNKTNTSAITEEGENTFVIDDVPDGNYTWKVECFDIFENRGESLTYNLTVREATSLLVNLTMKRYSYEKGELVPILTNVSDAIGNLLESNVTMSIIKGNTSIPWWNASYKYRQMLNLTNTFNDVLEENYTVNFTHDTQSLISQGKMNSSGYDLRVAYFSNATNSWTELDRIVENINSQTTKIMFKTMKNISANSFDDRYYIYYGNMSVANPPENKSKVYFFFDSFDANTSASYSLMHAFDDYANDDDNSTVTYDGAAKMMKYAGSNTKGKSITKNLPYVRNFIVEADQVINDYYTAGKFQLGARINGNSYYFLSVSTSAVYSSEIGVYVNGIKEYSKTSADRYTAEPAKHHSKLIVYDDGAIINMTAYVDDTLVFTYNDSNAARILAAGEAGAAYFRIPDGYWDNISVRKYLPSEPVVANGSEQQLIYLIEGQTSTSGTWFYTLNTSNMSHHDYSAASLADKQPSYKNGHGGRMFEIVPDTTPPAFNNVTIPTLIFNNNNVTILVNSSDRANNFHTILVEGNWTGSKQNYTMTWQNGTLYRYIINSTYLSSREFVFLKFFANDTIGNLNTTSEYNFTVVNSIGNVSINYPVYDISSFLNETFWVNATILAINGTIRNCNLTATYNSTGLTLLGNQNQVIGNLTNGSSSVGKWQFNSSAIGIYAINITSICWEGDSKYAFSAPVETLDVFANLSDTTYAEKKVINGKDYYHIVTETGLNIWTNMSDKIMNFNSTSTDNPWFIASWNIIIDDSTVIGLEDVTWDMRKIGVDVENNYSYISFAGRTAIPALRINLTKKVYENSKSDNISLSIENIGPANVDDVKVKWIIRDFNIDLDNELDNITFTNNAGTAEEYVMNSSTALDYDQSNFNSSLESTAYFKDSSNPIMGFIYWDWNMSTDGVKSGFNNFSFRAGGSNFKVNLTFDFGSLNAGQIKSFDPGAGLWSPDLIQRSSDISGPEESEAGTSYTDITVPLTDNNLETTSYTTARAGNTVRIINILNLSEISQFDSVYLRLYPTSIQEDPYPIILYSYNADNDTIDQTKLANFTFTASHMNSWVQINITSLAHSQDGWNYLRMRLTPNSSAIGNNKNIVFAEIGFNVSDEGKPAVALNYPVDDFNTTSHSINFNWTVVDKADINLTCNLTIDGKVNISNVDSLNGTPRNYSVSGFGDGHHYWNITCWDDSKNINTSETRFFTVVDAPEDIVAVFDSNDINITWNNKSYADSYAIFITTNYTAGFDATPNVTNINSLNWTDGDAALSTERYYKIGTVRGTANATSSRTVGKYDLELEFNWSFVGSPLNLTFKNLTDRTREPLPVNKYGCIRTVYRYNDSRNGKWEKVDFIDGTGWTPASGSGNFTGLEPWKGYWFETNESCNVTFVGRVEKHNVSVGLIVNRTDVSWLSTNDAVLPTNSEPPYYPFVVNPVNSVERLYRYDSSIQEFKKTDHYNGWGWWPATGSDDFISIEPGRGYYVRVYQNAVWTMEANR